MRAYEFILEERKGLYNYYKQQFPNWPDYVVRDFAVKNTKNFKTADDHKEWIRNTPGGYDAIEGWHRTMQHLNAYPQGYKGPAWVATPPPVDSKTIKSGSIRGGGSGGSGGSGGQDLSDPSSWQNPVGDVFQTSFDPKPLAKQMKYDAGKKGY